MSKILSITPVDDEHDLGWKITCDDKLVEFYIGNQPNCCEDWGGEIVTPDPIDYYIGADLLGVEPIFEEGGDRYGDYNDTVFLNVFTSVGILQFSVYNHHNGYYGHAVRLIVDGEVKDQWAV